MKKKDYAIMVALILLLGTSNITLEYSAYQDPVAGHAGNITGYKGDPTQSLERLWTVLGKLLE